MNKRTPKSTRCILAILLVTLAYVIHGQTITIEGKDTVCLEKGGKSESAAAMFHYLWPFVTKAELVHDRGKVCIHLGDTKAAEAFRDSKLANEGFVIAFPDEKNIVVWGPSEKGVLYGVVEFFRRYAGVRWLFPGEAGLHAPMHKRLTIPMKRISDQPKFVSRFFSWPYPFERRNDKEFLFWQRFNRLSNTIEFHHNLWRLFPPKKYFATHRHFYPKTMKEDSHYTVWNPKLTAKGLTEEAIRSICEVFRKDPKATSYSLGINDYSRFEDFTPAKSNSQGYPDYSDYYYSWVNRVIEGVGKEFPDKNFGMLAYVSITDPPSFRLDKRAVPFICIDRMSWYDKSCASRDRKRTIAWTEKAQQLGWYDYAYGNQHYFAPRIYNHLFADYIRFAVKHNVIAYYSEVYDSELPTEGPKKALMAQLLWNPETDVDTFLDEWYTLAVGAKAARYLKRYFDFWEDYWKTRGTATKWFQDNKSWSYLHFDDKTYLTLLTAEDLDMCDKMLATMRSKCDDATDAQKKRADIFLDNFRTVVRPRIEFALTTLHPRRLKNDKRLFRDDFNTPGPARNRPAPSWLFWQRFPGQSQAVHEPKGGEDSSGAVSIDLGAGQKALTLLQRSIAPEAGRIYSFRCKIRAQDTGNQGDIFTQIEYKTKDNVYQHFYSMRQCLEKKQRNGEWQTLELVFTTPPCPWQSANLSIGAQGVSKGKITVDTAELFQLKP